MVNARLLQGATLAAGLLQLGEELDLRDMMAALHEARAWAALTLQILICYIAGANCVVNVHVLFMIDDRLARCLERAVWLEHLLARVVF